jgi:hypothetical protein
MAQPSPKEVEKVMQRDFRPRGQATMDARRSGRLAARLHRHPRPPPSELARQLEADQMKTIVFPQAA